MNNKEMNIRAVFAEMFDVAYEQPEYQDVYEEGYGVYVISVASRLADMHPNTLRKYERAGFVNPGRTEGRQRLYSEDDVRRLKFVRALCEKYGLNLSSATFVLELMKLLSEALVTIEKTGDKEAKKAADKIQKTYKNLLKDERL